MVSRNQHNQCSLVGHACVVAIAGLIMLFASCSNGSVPRPKGYFRIDSYPTHYTPTPLGGISLHINDSARCITANNTADNGVHWLNIVYPRYNATLYLSYIPLKENLDRLMAESIEL
ncbi:MAG: hypothetical protein J6U43_03395, partial [Bacteroidales bacterium]|nr:hypothetical protein [Bacteroidales bacterium]